MESIKRSKLKMNYHAKSHNYCITWRNETFLDNLSRLMPWIILSLGVLSWGRFELGSFRDGSFWVWVVFVMVRFVQYVHSYKNVWIYWGSRQLKMETRWAYLPRLQMFYVAAWTLKTARKMCQSTGTRRPARPSCPPCHNVSYILCPFSQSADVKKSKSKEQTKI